MNRLPKVAGLLQAALTSNNSCSGWTDWMRRAPLRLLGELHAGNNLPGLPGSLLQYAGPGSPLRNTMLRCACKLVLVTRMREPAAWYRSFWEWSGVANKQRGNHSTDKFGETLIDFASRYSNLQSMILMGRVNLALSYPLHKYRCFEPSLHRPAPGTKSQPAPSGTACEGLPGRVEEVREALRAFDVVGIVERFDETLLLIADLSGLQHVLHRAHNVASKASKAVSNMGCDPPADCRAKIEALAPVDTTIYREVSAAFDARVKAQGRSFAKRLEMLRSARATTTPPRVDMVKAYSRLTESERCVGLLDGEGEAASQLCKQVNADTFIWVHQQAREGEDADMMHTVD
tara:strand:- start:226 stop:1263 length:1038 start_codon:yes stop_codon:yes gene_type:complete